MAAPLPPLVDRTPTTPPRHRVRATRPAGRRTRSLLLDAATLLFADRGLQDVSLTEIAAEADAFPSQVTYYFGSKEALFVEAACREVLHLGERVERAARPARTRAEYARLIARTALASPALLTFAEALLLARQRPGLAPLVDRALQRLHSEGARAWEERCQAREWSVDAPPEAVARGFWAIVLGLVLERAGSSKAFDHATAEAAVVATLSARYSSTMTETRPRRS